jgi:hypothetical protein
VVNYLVFKETTEFSLWQWSFADLGGHRLLLDSFSFAERFSERGIAKVDMCMLGKWTSSCCAGTQLLELRIGGRMARFSVCNLVRRVLNGGSSLTRLVHGTRIVFLFLWESKIGVSSMDITDGGLFQFTYCAGAGTDLNKVCKL